MSVGQYLMNACSMMRDWSKDRFPKQDDTVEKPFFDAPDFNKNTWQLAYDFLFKSNGSIQKYKEIYICVKKENKSMVTPNFINRKFNLINLGFNDFIPIFKKVSLIRLNRENWVKSNCSCAWYLKNYHCCHFVAVASNEKLCLIPIQYKQVTIEQKIKRGRKPKASGALEKN